MDWPTDQPTNKLTSPLLVCVNTARFRHLLLWHMWQKSLTNKSPYIWHILIIPLPISFEDKEFRGSKILQIVSSVISVFLYVSGGLGWSEPKSFQPAPSVLTTLKHRKLWLNRVSINFCYYVLAMIIMDVLSIIFLSVIKLVKCVSFASFPFC